MQRVTDPPWRKPLAHVQALFVERIPSSHTKNDYDFRKKKDKPLLRALK